jgi:SAM-dependent methyltransferase
MTDAAAVRERALASQGTSDQAIYRMVARILAERDVQQADVLLDVGCGIGALRPFVLPHCKTYHGVDVVHYDAFPPDCPFAAADLDAPRWPIADAAADLVVSVETVEHLENPRAFFRELTRITRPGGLIIVTTPNQLGLLSKLGLLLKNQFPAFQEAPGLYPAHRTALLEIDLLRIARECGWTDLRSHFSNRGRIPGAARHWPRALRGRPFSDNVAVSGRRL